MAAFFGFDGCTFTGTALDEGRCGDAVTKQLLLPDPDHVPPVARRRRLASFAPFVVRCPFPAAV